jgi:hypothetical protein
MGKVQNPVITKAKNKQTKQMTISMNKVTQHLPVVTENISSLANACSNPT